MPWVSKASVARSSKKDVNFAQQPELEKHALGIGVNVVTSHAVVRTEMIDVHGTLDVREGRPFYVQDLSCPAILGP